jgi:hypothetical protein
MIITRNLVIPFVLWFAGSVLVWGADSPSTLLTVKEMLMTVLLVLWCPILVYAITDLGNFYISRQEEESGECGCIKRVNGKYNHISKDMLGKTICRKITAKQIGSSSNVSDLYSRGTQFKSWSEHWPSWLRCSWIIPISFQFLIHDHPLISLSTR